MFERTFFKGEELFCLQHSYTMPARHMATQMRPFLSFQKVSAEPPAGSGMNEATMRRRTVPSIRKEGT